jgi:putative lipoic acid-binding regulatory protein
MTDGQIEATHLCPCREKKKSLESIAMEDSEGPLIGWSLSSGLKQRSLDQLISFPCQYSFKAVGLAEEINSDSILAKVAGIIERPMESVETKIRRSSTGKYASITFGLEVKSSEEVYQINHMLNQWPGIKYVL